MSDDVFEQARESVRADKKAAEEAAIPRWKDGTPKSDSPFKDSEGKPLDFERATAPGQYAYYATNREALIASRVYEAQQREKEAAETEERNQMVRMRARNAAERAEEAAERKAEAAKREQK